MSNPSLRRAEVCMQGRRAGLLSESERGCIFTYDETYLADGLPISFSLPLRSEPYTGPGLFPFFLGLLPEGWLLEITCRALKIDPQDHFGVLLATCQDCIGAVTIHGVDDEDR